MLTTIGNSVFHTLGGEQAALTIPFAFGDDAHIRAEAREADGTVRVLTRGTDYTITTTREGEGELVLLRDGLPAGTELRISRHVPLTQEISLPDYSPVPPRFVEAALDKLTMIAQELDARLAGCIETVEAIRDELKESPNTPGAATGDDDLVMVARTGRYHRIGCMYAEEDGKWIRRDELLRWRPKARPCRVCRPERAVATEADHVRS